MEEVLRTHDVSTVTAQGHRHFLDSVAVSHGPQVHVYYISDYAGLSGVCFFLDLKAVVELPFLKYCSGCDG